LHLGNLRTALVAWLAARSTGGRFVVRMEDLDLVVARRDLADRQLHDLAALGLDWDGPVVFQSDRTDQYLEAVGALKKLGLTYPCFCTRREIREAASAPNGPPLPDGAYPGTCRELSHHAQQRLLDAGRRPALRVRADATVVGFVDTMCGSAEAVVDDFVLVRNDGVFAYNLAVVVDDAAQGVEQVVRADDLLLSTPRQMWLGGQLGLPLPAHAHVPLVLGPDGHRLAKRHGAVSLGDLVQRGWTAAGVLQLLAQHLGLAMLDDVVMARSLVSGFSFERLPITPWQLTADDLASFDRSPA
jgi:glutamyl-tRNA synthetase